MKKNKYNILIICLILLSLSFSFYFPDGSKDSGLNFLKLEYIPFSSGMGGAISSLDKNVYAMHYNPAGLTGAKETVFFSHNNYPDEVFIEYLQYVKPLKKESSLGLSVFYMFTTIDGINGNGEFIGDMGIINSAYSLSLSGKLIDLAVNNIKILYGVNINYLFLRSYKYKNHIFTIDAGLILNVNNNINIGISFLNNGTSVNNFLSGIDLNNNNNDSPLPVNLKIGISKNIKAVKTIVSFDIDNYLYENQIYKIGVKYSPFDLLNLMIGYKILPDINNQFSFGFLSNFKFKGIGKVGISVSFTPTENIGSIVNFGLKIKL